MAVNDQKHGSVEETASAYVAARGKNGRMIHTSHAVRALREAMPRCDLSDREIAAAVAQIAVDRGNNICFDANGKEVISPPARSDFG